MTPLKMKNKVGHTSSTFLNSCFFQRYRPLSPVKFGNFNDHPLALTYITLSLHEIFYLEGVPRYSEN